MSVDGADFLADNPAVLYIGIDPGKTGAIAILGEDGRVEHVRKMPETPRDVFIWLRGIAGMGPRRALLERVHSQPEQGHVGAFHFGQGFGHLEMALIATNTPYDLVVPQKWQRWMDCRSGGDKNVTKARAQTLFPALTITHAIADALLMAECCRRMAPRAATSTRRMRGIHGEEEESRGQEEAGGPVPPSERQYGHAQGPRAAQGDRESEGREGSAASGSADPAARRRPSSQLAR